MAKKRFKKGDMVKNRLSREVGIVTDIMGDPTNPYAIYVTIEGRKRKWVLRQKSSVSLVQKIKNVF